MFNDDLNDDIKITIVNKKKLKENVKAKLAEKNLGKKGKIRLTIEGILTSVAVVWETLYNTMPLFSEWVATKKSILDTKFFAWLAEILNNQQATPNFEGLSPEAIYRMGQQSGSENVVDASSSVIGQIFSAVLQFIIENPTICVLGGTAIATILTKPFLLLIKKIKKTLSQKKTKFIENQELLTNDKKLTR